MWLGMRGCLADALTDTLDEISCTNSDRLDEQRRRAILQVMKCPQIDPGIFVGITKQTADKGYDGIAVGLWEGCLLCHWLSSPGVSSGQGALLVLAAARARRRAGQC